MYCKVSQKVKNLDLYFKVGLYPSMNFIIDRLLPIYGLTSLSDNKNISKEVNKDVPIKILELIPEISIMYLKIRYLENPSFTNCITILKHFLNVHNYTVRANHLVVKGKKRIWYNVVCLKNKLENVNMLISFD